MDNQKFMSVLGFANRAGKCAVGRSAAIGAFKRQKLHCLIVAQDASDKIEKLQKEFAATPVCKVLSKAELAALFGRNDLAVIGITDAGFAQSLLKLARN